MFFCTFMLLLLWFSVFLVFYFHLSLSLCSFFVLHCLQTIRWRAILLYVCAIVEIVLFYEMQLFLLPLLLLLFFVNIVLDALFDIYFNFALTLLLYVLWRSERKRMTHYVNGHCCGTIASTHTHTSVLKYMHMNVCAKFFLRN